MSIFGMVIPDEIVLTIITVLVTNVGQYMYAQIQKRKKNTEIQEIKQFIGDIFSALCNSNGYGETFQKEYKQITKNRNERDRRQNGHSN